MDLGAAFTWLMIALRAGGMMVTFPGMNIISLPPTMRVAVALTLATLMQPMVSPLAEVPGTIPGLIGAAAIEVGLGLLIGFVSRLTFHAVDMAAQIITTEIGLAATPGVDGPVSLGGLPVLMNRFALVLFFSSGAHLLVLSAFARSFGSLAVGGGTLAAGASDLMIEATARVISSGVQVAAPFIALNFLLTLAFGLLGRTVPKTNVFVLSFSARSLAGLAMLSGAGVLFGRFILGRFGEMPFEILEFFPRAS